MCKSVADKRTSTKSTQNESKLITIVTTFILEHVQQIVLNNSRIMYM